MGILKATSDENLVSIQTMAAEAPPVPPHTQIVTNAGVYAVSEPYEEVVAEIGNAMGNYRFNETFMEYTTINDDYYYYGAIGGNGKSILIKLDQIIAVMDKSV